MCDLHAETKHMSLCSYYVMYSVIILPMGFRVGRSTEGEATTTAGVVLSSSVCVANSISHTQLGMPTQCRISHEEHTLSVVSVQLAPI